MGTFTWTNLEALITAPDEKLRTISMGIRKDAQSMCPVDTGRLRKSLHVRSRRMRGNRLAETIYSNVEYAAYQEFGTRYIAPVAFMGRALANARQKYG